MSIRVQTTLNHISICFLPQHQRQKSVFFFRTRAEKGIARHMDASSVVWTLIDDGKLANQIARLATIVVKYSVPTMYFAVTIFHVLLLSYFPPPPPPPHPHKILVTGLGPVSRKSRKAICEIPNRLFWKADL